MKGTKRPGRGFVADYYLGGKRVRRSFKTAALRDAHLDEARDLERRMRGLSRFVDRAVTVATFALRWLAGLDGGIKARTLQSYRAAVELYIVPRLGSRLVAELHRQEVKAFLLDCRACGVGKRPLKHGSVYAIYAALRALLNEAVEEGIIAGNPAARLGKKLHLHPTKQHRKAAVEARVLSPERLRRLLEHCRIRESEAYPLLLTLARTGVRVGELIALRLDDYEPESRRLLVARSWNEKQGQMETPKHGARRLDVSPQLAAVLDAHTAALRKVLGLDGKPLSGLLFPSQAWTMLDARNVRRLLDRLATDSGLDRKLGPHDLRHTYGSQLTAAGIPPQYIQAQMGHASIQMTIDLYGSGLPVSYQQGVECLDSLPLKSRPDGRKVAQSVRTGHKTGTNAGKLAGGGDVNV
ncbi:MAG TPA: tyrosine-type recombinase/integrase [Steroidobacteraceae bacterium]|nr:tyrosine-type recombinase/integrase [Steroidobacteraceae bacterium]